ncbi:hypothetical protein SBV1_650003 [Verrucomicrobia bacterium]|nr:hypothetical protein SBV1_650003 [Verrucomicrobiota bacterium]
MVLASNERMSTKQKTAGAEAGGKRRPLRVLVVEDCPPDAILLARALERGGFQPFCERVDTREAMEQALEQELWDLILADHAMPNFNALEALAVVRRCGLDVPFIIVSGQIEEETAVAAMNSGAHDYVMKDRLARLVPAVERELCEAAVRRARQEYEEELRRAREELEIRVEQRTAELKAANLKLQSVIEERKRLENELLEIAENERRRIGFDLHDDVGQKLTGVSLMVKGLQQRLGAERHPCALEAGKIQQLTEEVTKHMHDLAHQTSSLDVQGDDLPGLLHALTENVKRMFEISCVFTFKGAVPELPAHTATQLYKIAQEAVSNAIKHGKASRVWIGLTHNSEILALTVKNDGLPFSLPAAAKNRMGLRIMNYRASTIGATLEITPQNQNGTLVTCSLPANESARTARRELSGRSRVAA